MNTTSRHRAYVLLAAVLVGCSLANPIPDITGGEIEGDAATGGGAGGGGGSSGSGGVGGTAGAAGSSGTGGGVVVGGGGGTGGGGTGGGTGGVIGCASSTAELCADFDSDPWDSKFSDVFLAEGGGIQEDTSDSVSSPRSALATVPAVASGVFGAGSLTYALPASFSGLTLSLDVKLETAPGPEGTSIFLFQLAQPNTSHSGVQLIVGSDSQGLHETPGGFHQVNGLTFPTGWAHVEFSMTLSPSATATVVVEGVTWLNAVPLTPPPLNAPYFAVGIVQVNGPTSAPSALRIDNVVLDLQ